MKQQSLGPHLMARRAFVTTKTDQTVAQLLLDYLKLEGVTTLFGVPGGALVYLSNELRIQHDKFNFVICRHETGAAYMAHGYAQVSAGLGVVLTTAGPGATNAVTGMMNAQASNCSVLHISGEVSQDYYGEGYLQEGVDARLDIGVMYRSAVEYSTVISSEANFSTLFQQALRTSRSLPTRAAHVSLPNNIAGQRVTGADKKDPHRFSFPKSVTNYRATPRCTDIDAVHKAFDQLAAATRPVIFLGNGARRALADPARRTRFTDMVERFGFPVMTTPDAKGIFPESHQWSLRNYGLTACSWPLKYIDNPDYDALLVLGSALGELATTVIEKDHYSKKLIPSEHFIQVDLDQGVIGRVFPVTSGIVADIGATMDAMCDYADQRKPDTSKFHARETLIAQIKASTSAFADPKGRDSNSAPLHPAALVRVMNDTIRTGQVFIDAGNCVGWSLNNMVIDPPLCYHSALDMGPMGYAVGAVVGGKIAAPDHICIALVGDGAFMMAGAEISTAAQNNVGAIWVVLYDNNLGMISDALATVFPPATNWSDYYKLGEPDLVLYSQGLGAQAVAITPDQGPQAFEQALTTAIDQAGKNAKPQVIVAHIDTRVSPPYGWPTIGTSS